MFRRLALTLTLASAVLAALLAGFGTSTASAQSPIVELAGHPFYFSATCTQLGNVILFNEAVAPRPALVVVGEQAVVVPTYDNPHAPSNGTCTLTGGGFSIDTIELFDEPFTLDVLIVP